MVAAADPMGSVALDVDVPADLADGDGGPNTIRYPGVGNRALARPAYSRIRRNGLARRQNLPCRHLHVWQKALYERADKMDSVQVTFFLV